MESETHRQDTGPRSPRSYPPVLFIARRDAFLSFHDRCRTSCFVKSSRKYARRRPASSCRSSGRSLTSSTSISAGIPAAPSAPVHLAGLREPRSPRPLRGSVRNGGKICPDVIERTKSRERNAAFFRRPSSLKECTSECTSAKLRFQRDRRTGDAVNRILGGK